MTNSLKLKIRTLYRLCWIKFFLLESQCVFAKKMDERLITFLWKITTSALELQSISILFVFAEKYLVFTKPWAPTKVLFIEVEVSVRSLRRFIVEICEKVKPTNSSRKPDTPPMSKAMSIQKLDLSGIYTTEEIALSYGF